MLDFASTVQIRAFVAILKKLNRFNGYIALIALKYGGI